MTSRRLRSPFWPLFLILFDCLSQSDSQSSDVTTVVIPTSTPWTLGERTVTRYSQSVSLIGSVSTVTSTTTRSSTSATSTGTASTLNVYGVKITLPISVGIVVGINCTSSLSSCPSTNWTGAGTHDLAALPVVASALSKRADWQPLQTVNFKIYNAGGAEADSIEAAISAASEDNTLAVVGLENTCLHEPGIISIYDKFLISHYCSERPSSGQSSFQFVQIRPSIYEHMRAMVDFLKQYQLNRVVIVMFNDRTSDSISAESQLELVLLDADITLVKLYEIESDQIDNYVPLESSTRLQYAKILTETYTQTRAYIVLSQAPMATESFFFLDVMSRMGLLQTGEYAVLTCVSRQADYMFDNIDKTSSVWLTYPTKPNRPYESRLLRRPLVSEVFQNYRSHALFIDSKPVSNPTWQKFVSDVNSVWKNPCPLLCNYPLQGFPKNYPENYVPITTAFMYDSVMTYLQAFMELVISNMTDPKSGATVAQQFVDRRIQSISGVDIYVDVNGVPMGNISILTAFRKPNDQQLGLHQIAQFWLNETQQGIFWYIQFMYDAIPMNWVNGVPPVVPKCNYDGSSCIFLRNYSREIFAGLGAAAGLILIGLCALFYRQWRYERELQSLFFKIHSKDLIIQNLFDQFSSMKSFGSDMLNVMQSTATLRMHKSHASLRERERTPKSIEDKEPILDPKRNRKPKMIRIGRNQRKMPENEDVQRRLWTQLDNFGIAVYKGNLVALKRIHKKQVEFTRDVRKELKTLMDIHHDNINTLLGIVHEPPLVFLVTEFRQRGNLKDMLENDDIQLDAMFLASMIFDLLKGLSYIHGSQIRIHGNLKSTNCVLDTRWVLRVSSFGLVKFREGESRDMENEDQYKTLLWTAPELLRDPILARTGSQKADIYAFGIILHEIYSRKGPFGDDFLDPIEIIEQVKHPQGEQFTRPDLSIVPQAPDYVQLAMSQCWDERPGNRPACEVIKKRLHPLQNGLKSNVFDNMITMMEKYSSNLEEIVAERTFQLQEEKKKTERILLMILPRTVAEALKRGQTIEPERYESVTIYYSDIVGFTSMSSDSSPVQVVTFLNDLYTCFDAIINNFDVYKVETIGDAYMVVSGLPVRNGDNHAGEIASMCLRLLDAVMKFKIRHRPTDMLKLRIGIHSGTCLAGVVGLKMPRFCLFGSTVQTASKMEQTGEAMKIHCSADCKEVLDRIGGYHVIERGFIEIKANSEQMTYWVISEDLRYREDRIARESIKYPTLKKTNEL